MVKQGSPDASETANRTKGVDTSCFLLRATNVELVTPNSKLRHVHAGAKPMFLGGKKARRQGRQECQGRLSCATGECCFGASWALLSP